MNAHRSSSGPLRKGRRRLQHVPFGAYLAENFLPKEEDWRSIESAYGVKLSPADREQIIPFVVTFFRGCREERGLAATAEAIECVRKFKSHAQTLLDQVFISGAVPGRNLGASIGANICAQTSIASNFPDDRWKVFLEVLEALPNACNNAENFLDLPLTIEPYVSRSWDILICELTRFASARGYPVGAAKHSDKRASPFVAFVRELQCAFPQAFHSFSNDALAQAIGEARRRLKEHFS